ncbi:MAG: hypothetical protein IAG10_24265, partial [Planctomycetaceae bacterium]|nr:hypothetical protein [Planctomycetaceae bacterium]
MIGCCSELFPSQRSRSLLAVAINGVFCATTAVFAYVVAALEPRSARADTTPSIEVIRAGYTQSVSSIQTLDCHYRVALRILDQSKIEKGVKGTLNWYEIHDIRDGKKIAVKFDAGTEGGMLTNRFWGGFDGKNYSSWTESKQENSDYFLPGGSVTNKRPSYLGMPFLIHRFLGFEVNGGFDLDDLLLRTESRVVSAETVQAKNCILVDIGEHPQSEKFSKTIRTKVWFDPQVGYLPRQLRCVSASDGKLLLEIVVT